jgi:putative transposase
VFSLFLRTPAALIAENLFLRKQLALFQERQLKPKRTSVTTRFWLVLLGRFFNWRDALVIVKPETFVKWHRMAFRWFWKWKSRKRGRPALPRKLRELVGEMARNNPTWGEERIADELMVKFGVKVSPRTVRKYLKLERPRGGRSDQRWSTFVRNHAKDCGVRFLRDGHGLVLYVFVAMEIGSRRILHCNLTEHPTAEWTTQQFREMFADPLCSAKKTSGAFCQNRTDTFSL